MERVFTHAEATALLPELTRLLTALRDVHRASLEHAADLDAHPVTSNGSASAAMRASGPFHEAQRLTADIDGLGVILRDPETGLVDFASVREGAPVYLCWRLGEARIGYWHSRDTGFMGRLPL
ncbi:MAG TPA: DUF2203 domain-containing protein [Candidatus Saccharimonadales bacterium]|nr:DUF2203 domain-containing protein [Candidatus Saccharimonadales bacterium]